MRTRFECRYRDCERDAYRGWTMCKQHYSAGMNRKSWQRIEAERRRREVKP